MIETQAPIPYEESTGDLKAAASKPVNPLDMKPRRRVTINGKVKIREIPHLNDTDEDIISSTFLTQEDYAEFKKSYTVIVRKMMKLQDAFVSDDGENCSRGLGTYLFLLSGTECSIELEGRPSSNLSLFPFMLP
jgi:hypothetical protein